MISVVCSAAKYSSDTPARFDRCEHSGGDHRRLRRQQPLRASKLSRRSPHRLHLRTILLNPFSGVVHTGGTRATALLFTSCSMAWRRPSVAAVEERIRCRHTRSLWGALLATRVFSASAVWARASSVISATTAGRPLDCRSAHRSLRPGATPPRNLWFRDPRGRSEWELQSQIWGCRTDSVVNRTAMPHEVGMRCDDLLKWGIDLIEMDVGLNP